MKTKKIFFVVFILLILAITYSCQDKKSDIIIGKWKLDKFYSTDSTKISKEMEYALGLMALNLGMTGETLEGNIIKFLKDETFKIITKEGKSFQKGEYKLTEDNKFLILNYDSGDKEKYEIVKINNDELQLKFDKEPIYINFSKIRFN